MNIRAVIHEAEEGGWWAEVPALPGCVTQGETLDEVRENIRSAAELWLEACEPRRTMRTSDQIMEFAV